MTNWKDGAPKGARGKKKSEKNTAEKKWKKVENVQRTISTVKDKISRNNEKKTKEPDADAKGATGPDPTGPDPDVSKTHPDEPIAEVKDCHTEGNDSEVAKSELKNNTERTATPRADAKSSKEETQLEEEDPKVLLRNKIFEIIKNGFSIANTEDGEIHLSVDNIYPLLKALGLNPQNESVMDLVREACMESSGDIQPSHFDEVVLSLVKQQDLELWGERLAEKKRDALKESSEKAKAEAERLKKQMEQGVTEEEEEESWEEMDRKAKIKAKEKELEKQQDELYDNIKMAFRFIDSDEDGVISVRDVYNLMMGLGEMLDDDELYGMVTMADVDCDGKLTFKDFKKFLMRGTAEEVKSDEEGEDLLKPTSNTDAKEPASDDIGVSNDEMITTDEAEKAEISNKSTDEAETGSASKMRVQEPKEDDSSKAKRKQSLLWGYTSAANKVDTVNEKQQDESVSESTKDQEKVVVTKDNVDSDEIQDNTAFLNAIKEEDEQSSYGPTESSQQHTRMEQRTMLINDGKRKMFSRQSSAASLRNRPNSIITNSESTVEDSGFETLDTNMDCSEIREVPDVFDISDDESELKKLTSPTEARSRDSGDSDEDKIDEECVRESLSRFSSLSQKEGEESDDEKDLKLPHIDRGDKFVNEYMYVGVDSKSDLEEMSNEMKSAVRLRKAEKLQRAIFRRSNTEPVFNHRYVPKPPSTSKTNINGIKCSHIDIDLRCDIPPKADIKSFRQFSDRVQSARTRSKTTFFDTSGLERKMSIVDMTDLVSENAFISDGDVSRWPNRSLIRPKSSRNLRSPVNAWEKDVQTAPARRTRSAIPHINRAERSESSMRQESYSSRPMTANMTYSSPRRTVPDSKCATMEKKGDFTIVTSEPFAKSDQLYPRKTLLTSCHHGFRSIWPIGRNINVLQNKRPFDSFEMNSYSRAVEREAFSFKGETGLENKENDSKTGQRATKTIKLELDIPTRPKLKRIPILLPCNFTPHTVR